jgi:hypothetical protein
MGGNSEGEGSVQLISLLSSLDNLILLL